MNNQFEKSISIKKSGKDWVLDMKKLTSLIEKVEGSLVKKEIHPREIKALAEYIKQLESDVVRLGTALKISKSLDKKNSEIIIEELLEGLETKISVEVSK